MSNPQRSRRARCVLVGLALALGGTQMLAQGFSPKTAPSVSAAQARGMKCRYFTELLGMSSGQSFVERQLQPIAATEVDTVVCCPMGWRFYNFPSEVDTTWREPDKHPRHQELYSGWKKMVDNLAKGGDPLRDALAATRRMGKRFIVSFRMNDSHYVHLEQFPTHNNFWREHPELRLGRGTKPSDARTDNAALFDYLKPQVRDFYFAVLEEMCTKYEVDGVELDFQRAPRFFHDREVDAGRTVMTAHVRRIREMLDRVGRTRGRQLELSVRVLPTVDENFGIGVDVLAWDAAGWLDGIIVSPGYIHTVDVGIEEFVARRRKAQVWGELNFLHLQLAGTGHNPQDRRYLTAENYRAATLSYLERGADGVSFFNTYCIPAPQLGRLTAALLRQFKDIDVLRRSDKNYTSYATKSTIFGSIFPARKARDFQMFVADPIPGRCERAVLRLETKASCREARVEAWINGTKLPEYAAGQAELFPPVMVNQATPKMENLKFFSVPLSALKFGANRIAVKNADGAARPCDFVSAELALYMRK